MGNHVHYKDVTPYVVVADPAFPARGSFGVVEKVCLISDNKKVYARKQLYLAGEENAARIEKEIAVLRSFRHPHVVPFHGSYKLSGSTFLMFELCEMTLGRFLSHPPQYFQQMPTGKALGKMLNWMLDLTSALHAFHTLGSMHRDIKPENILLKGDHIYLSDFGLATQSSAPSQHPASISGTEMYKAPEMETNAKYSRKSDVFSLGCVFLEILAVANNKSVETFRSFRQTYGNKSCHRSEHTCYRHNLNACHNFIDTFIKRAKGIEYVIDVIQKEMMAETPYLRSSAHDVWTGIFRGAAKVEGFKKEACCEGDIRRAGYNNLSVESITRRLQAMGIKDDRAIGVVAVEQAEKPMKKALY
jgi:serine/threonine protein kinase